MTVRRVTCLGFTFADTFPPSAPARVLVAPSAVLTGGDSVEAVPKSGEVFVDFVRPDGGVGAVLEQRVEVEAPCETSAASTRVTFVPLGGAVEVGGDPGSDVTQGVTTGLARLTTPSAASRVAGVSEELVPVVVGSGHSELVRSM